MPSIGAINLQRPAGGLTMHLSGGIYMGALTVEIELSRQPPCRYVDEPKPKIVVEQSSLPETVLAAMNAPSGGGNRVVLLSDVIGHPFVTVYDPPISAVINMGEDLEIALTPGCTTLAPVPAAAMRVLPTDADPGRPWELTPRELKAIRAWLPTQVSPAR